MTTESPPPPPEKGTPPAFAMRPSSWLATAFIGFFFINGAWQALFRLPMLQWPPTTGMLLASGFALVCIVFAFQARQRPPSDDQPPGPPSSARRDKPLPFGGRPWV
ncbi:MAG: hypothetical protein EA425_05140 [Puniceicoccaceae bacterium]|nr:MAG: hypothetical protein EA425_05140 [Puniceicoccaceae bacterium]